MSGIFFTNGRQHVDLDTEQNHNAPDTTSDLLYKGALKDKSRSVWQGMIKALPGSQRIDGFQANRNLMLDKDARADSIPGWRFRPMMCAVPMLRRSASWMRKRSSI